MRRGKTSARQRPALPPSNEHRRHHTDAPKHAHRDPPRGDRPLRASSQGSAVPQGPPAATPNGSCDPTSYSRARGWPCSSTVASGTPVRSTATSHARTPTTGGESSPSTSLVTVPSMRSSRHLAGAYCAHGSTSLRPMWPRACSKISASPSQLSLMAYAASSNGSAASSRSEPALTRSATRRASSGGTAFPSCSCC